MNETKKLEIEFKNDIYADPEYVSGKWIKNYGRLSEYADSETFVSCIKEAFNMTEIVMGHIIYVYQQSHRGFGENVWIESGNGKRIKATTNTFFGKIKLLELMGYNIPENIDDVRVIRNATTHNTATVIGVVYNENLSYENVVHAMELLGSLLVELGMLGEEDIIPPFEKMRVSGGDCIGPSNEYRIDEFVAEGGMSRVYKGTHLRLGNTIAIKELKPYTYRPDQILAEKDFLVSMRHPQIPQIFDIISQNGTNYIVMEYIEGTTLDEYVKKFEPDIEERFAIAFNIATVLEYIHNDCNMIYADLKPDNIMISRGGGVYIIDFSISQAAGERNVADAFNLLFSAPEQRRGEELGKSADIYAYGGILDWLFQDKEVLGYEKADMELLIAGCKQDAPQDRVQSISLVKERLLEISRDTLNKTVIKKKRRRITILAVLASLIAASIIMAFVYINITYPKGQVYKMKGTFKPSIEETDEGIEAELSLYNRSDEDILRGKVYMMTVNMVTKDGRCELRIPCKLDDGLKSGDMMLSHKYVVKWETLGIEKEDIIQIDKDHIDVKLF